MEKKVIIFPEMIKKNIQVENVREKLEKLTYQKNGLEFCKFISSIKDFKHEENLIKYNKELISFVKTSFSAKEVIPFDHTLRLDSNAKRPPVRQVHNDYSIESAYAQLQKYVDNHNLELWEDSHFAIINSWKPIENIVQTAPLGFILPDTIEKDDFIDIELIYPNRVGEIQGVIFNEKHNWVFMENMSPEEIAFFRVFDSNGAMPVVHSAFDPLELSDTTKPRQSIESRMLVRF